MYYCTQSHVQGYAADVIGLDPVLAEIIRRIHNSLKDMGVEPEQLFRRRHFPIALDVSPTPKLALPHCMWGVVTLCYQ